MKSRPPSPRCGRPLSRRRQQSRHGGFGLADQLGTIEPGKLANIIVTNGDPLEIQTEVRFLFIKGQLTSTENRHRQLYEQYRKRPQEAH